MNEPDHKRMLDLRGLTFIDARRAAALATVWAHMGDRMATSDVEGYDIEARL